MTEAKQPAVFVDGNNVMGSRADGWWRNRAEAAGRLVSEIAPLARGSGAAWTIVFDGARAVRHGAGARVPCSGSYRTQAPGWRG